MAKRYDSFDIVLDIIKIAIIIIIGGIIIKALLPVLSS